TLGRCLNGTLPVKQGDDAGLDPIRSALDWLRDAGFGYQHAIFLGVLAEGLTMSGKVAEAQVVAESALAQCDRNEERWCLSCSASRARFSKRAARPTPWPQPRIALARHLDWHTGRERCRGSCGAH